MHRHNSPIQNPNTSPSLPQAPPIAMHGRPSLQAPPLTRQMMHHHHHGRLSTEHSHTDAAAAPQQNLRSLLRDSKIRLTPEAAAAAVAAATVSVQA